MSHTMKIHDYDNLFTKREGWWKSIEVEGETYMWYFIDLENSYDRLPRDVHWKALKKKGVCVSYIKTILDMYGGVLSKVRTLGVETKNFPFMIDLSSKIILKSIFI